MVGLGAAAMLIYAMRGHLSATNVLVLLALPVSLALLPALIELPGLTRSQLDGSAARRRLRHVLAAPGLLTLGLVAGVGPYVGWYVVQGAGWTWIEGVFFRPNAIAVERYTGLQPLTWRGLALACAALAPTVYTLVRAWPRFRPLAPVAFVATALAAPAIVLWAQAAGLAPRLSADAFQAGHEVFAYLPFAVYAGTCAILGRRWLPALTGQHLVVGTAHESSPPDRPVGIAAVQEPARSKPPASQTSFTLAGLVVFGAFLYTTVYPLAYPQYLSYVSAPAFVLIGYFVDQQMRALRAGHGGLVGAVRRLLPLAGPAVLIASAVTFHLLPERLNADLRATIRTQRWVSHQPDVLLDARRARLFVAAAEAATLHRVVALILARTGANGTLFVYGYQPMLYYLTELRNPTPFIDPILYPTPAEYRQIADQLEASTTPVVVLFHGWPARTPANAALQDYLHERYVVGEVIGDFTLLVRREDTRATRTPSHRDAMDSAFPTRLTWVE